MIDAYDYAKEMAFHKIDCATKRGLNSVNYSPNLDVPEGMENAVARLLTHNLRKLGYNVKYRKGIMVISWT